MNNIINPINNQKVSIFSKQGKNILKNFVKNFKMYTLKGGMNTTKQISTKKEDNDDLTARTLALAEQYQYMDTESEEEEEPLITSEESILKVSNNPLANKELHIFKKQNPTSWWSEDNIEILWKHLKKTNIFDHDTCLLIRRHMEYEQHTKKVDQLLNTNNTSDIDKLKELLEHGYTKPELYPAIKRKINDLEKQYLEDGLENDNLDYDKLNSYITEPEHEWIKEHPELLKAVKTKLIEMDISYLRNLLDIENRGLIHQYRFSLLKLYNAIPNIEKNHPDLAHQTNEKIKELDEEIKFRKDNYYKLTAALFLAYRGAESYPGEEDRNGGWVEPEFWYKDNDFKAWVENSNNPRKADGSVWIDVNGSAALGTDNDDNYWRWMYHYTNDELREVKRTGHLKQGDYDYV